jgi:hypothetical protein
MLTFTFFWLLSFSWYSGLFSVLYIDFTTPLCQYLSVSTTTPLLS